VVGKFAWHLPLNRQTDILRGQGIALDRSTLVHWVIRAAWWLKPLHTLLVGVVLASPKVFCDDTPLPVLDRRRRRTRTGRSMIDRGKDLRRRRWSTSLRRIEKAGAFMSI
jgi:transposase